MYSSISDKNYSRLDSDKSNPNLYSYNFSLLLLFTPCSPNFIKISYNLG